MKVKNIMIIFMLTLILMVASVNIYETYGEEFVKGQSLIAKNQKEASMGLSFPQLNITWLDLKDNQIISYGTPEGFDEGIFALDLSGGTLCFDTSGKIIAFGDYSGVYGFSDGVAKVYKYLPQSEPYVPGMIMAPPGRMEGFIDREGNEIIPLGKLYGLGDYFGEGFAVIGEYEENKGYINKAGEIVIPMIYKDAGAFSEGLAPVQSADTMLWGFIDKEGKQVIPMMYEEAKPFSEGCAYVVKGGKTGYIDTAGNIVVDFKFMPDDQYKDTGFHGGMAVARDSSGKYGYQHRLH